MTYVGTGKGLLRWCLSPLATVRDGLKAQPSLASLSPESLPVSGGGPAWGSNGGRRVEHDCKCPRVQGMGGRPVANSWAVQAGACQEGWGGEVP